MSRRPWPPSRQKTGKFRENTTLARHEGRCRYVMIALFLGKSIDSIFNDVQICVALGGWPRGSLGVIVPISDVLSREASHLIQQR